MKEINKEQVIGALQVLGLRPGDGVLVHSAIQFLGRTDAGPGLYLDALCAVLNIPFPQTTDSAMESDLPIGTLVVPTFNFAFARGEPYDPHSTPSQKMGVFSEYVRQQPGVARTPHPLQSLAGLGRWAADLVERDTPSAFDPGGPFDRMLELDFKILLLGADIDAISLIHYSEQQANVPYRYWKEFSGEVLTPQGWQTRTYRMFARDMDLDPHLTLHPVLDVLQARGLWHAVPLNYGQISLVGMRELVSVVDEFLSADPYSLMLNRPQVNYGYHA